MHQTTAFNQTTEFNVHEFNLLDIILSAFNFMIIYNNRFKVISRISLRLV